MATYIKSLSPESYSAKRNALGNVKKPLSDKSPKGKRQRKEEKRRDERDSDRSLKHSTIRNLKKMSGSIITREPKIVLPALLFAGMTPRQVKRIKKDETRLQNHIDKYNENLK